MNGPSMIEGPSALQGWLLAGAIVADLADKVVLSSS
jgi:hypothetical protein